MSNGLAKRAKSQKNSRMNKLEERIRKKREDIVKRQQVFFIPPIYPQEQAENEESESEDQEEDVEEEDVIKSVKNVLEGAEKKIPAKEDFFSFFFFFCLLPDAHHLFSN